MHLSTRQFTLTGGQQLSPLVRLDYHYTGSLANMTSDKFTSLLNQMHLSTRQFTLSGGQALCPLVRLVRLDYHYTTSLANINSNDISKSP